MLNGYMHLIADRMKGTLSGGGDMTAPIRDQLKMKVFFLLIWQICESKLGRNRLPTPWHNYLIFQSHMPTIFRSRKQQLLKPVASEFKCGNESYFQDWLHLHIMRHFWHSVDLEISGTGFPTFLQELMQLISPLILVSLVVWCYFNNQITNSCLLFNLYNSLAIMGGEG